MEQVEDYSRGATGAQLLALVKPAFVADLNAALCLHMHTKAIAAGEQQARLLLLDAWHESSMYSQRERAALVWAESLTNVAQTHAPDRVYAEAKSQFSEKELRSVDSHCHDQRLEPACHRGACRHPRTSNKPPEHEEPEHEEHERGC